MFDDRRTTGRPSSEGAPRLAVTFDNLGEAGELERGDWPAGRPLGRHPSITVALPRLLDELARHGLGATFFVEAINCELYPEAVRSIAARGYELGLHGWRHESWGELDPSAEAETLERGAAAFARLGISVRAFRPPGGELSPSSAELLARAGIEWCSPAADAAAAAGELPALPFKWSAVDAYWLMPSFEAARRSRGDPAGGRPPGEVLELVWSEVLDGPTTEPGVLVLHPFLMLEEEWWQGVRELLARIAAAVAAGELTAGAGGAYVLSDGAAL